MPQSTKNPKNPKAPKTRAVSDSLGALRVPADALYGAQTQRAIDNFPISGETMPPEFIHALALIKFCAAEANMELGLLNRRIGRAICKAATAVMNGAHADQFPVDVFQTGSGTSSNMNINEALATLAARESNMTVDPNDHVNMGQSSNDTIPTAIHISAVVLIRNRLLPALALFARTIAAKAKQSRKIVKTGRTHLMDAMPLTLAQEMGAWELQARKSIARVESALPRLQMIAQGGTAVGTGVNAHRDFAPLFARILSRKTGIAFAPNESFFESMAAQDAAVEMSGQLKTVAVSVMKIANDLRWMNSGPLAGLGEIRLPALQPGSSIMPGKVNPVLPEAAAMVAAQVIGNDAAITVAGQSGNFQLNVMLPLIARNLLQSARLLANVLPLLAEKAVAGFEPSPARIEESLARNPILVTALNPVIGYAKAAAIAKRAYREERMILDVAAEETGMPKTELARLLHPAKLTKGGV